MGSSGRGRSGAWVLVGLAALGIVGTGLSIQRMRVDARDRDRQAVGLVAERVSSSLLTTVSSLRVNDVLMVDGVVTDEEFAVHAADVLPESRFIALAFAEPVDDVDRDTWEAATGVEVVDSDGRGGWSTAPRRDDYVVVRRVFPPDTARVVGFDLLGDPTRARAVREAAASDRSVIVGPIALATSGGVGLFLADAVRTPDGAVAGFVSGGIGVGRFTAAAEALPDIEPVSLWMDGELLVGDGRGRTVSFEAAGRTFTVASGDARPWNWWLPAIVALGTVLLCGGAVRSMRLVRRERERQRWLSLRNQRLADFAELLAVASTADEVVTVTLDHAGAVVGADHTSVGRRDADPSKLRVVDDVPFEAGHLDVVDRIDEVEPRERATERIVRLDVGLPITDCVMRASPVVLPDVVGLRHDYPQFVDAARRGGRRATICVPLGLGNESPRGAIAYSWSTELAAHRIDDLVATAGLVAQMVGRALERAQVRQVVQGRVDLLGELARSLTTAGTRQQVSDVVADLLPSVLDVRRAVLAPPDDRPDEPWTRSYAPQSTDEVSLHLVLDDPDAWNATYESLTQAVLDFVDGAWVRAALYDHEHSVLQRFQATLLTAPPTVEGLDIAVGYRSAVEAVGIGGDWYSVIAHDGGLAVVIGDIAGHGPGAVAHMAEVKTIMRHLLMNGSPIEDAVEHAHAVLERRDACASAVVVHIDRANERLRVINAGHPAPIVVGPAGAVVLSGVQRPWLGVAGAQLPPTEVAFPDGATLLLYTDGLVEERGEAIDVSIDRLAARVADRVAACADDPTALVEHLLEWRATDRRPTSVDDDIALVAITRR